MNRRPSEARWRRWLGACLILCLSGALGAGSAEERGGPSRSVGVGPLLASLDRVIHLEIVNAPLRDTFGELARAGNLKIVVDPTVREDLRVNAVLKGLALGDALSMVCSYAQLQLLPGEGRVLVAPQPAIAVAPGAVPNAPAPVQPNVNPWQAWFELGLPLVPGGRTGYPRLFAGAIACPRCQAPMQPQWAFCPRCGQQRGQKAQGRYCYGCGRPLHEAPAATTPQPGGTPHLQIIPMK